MSEEYIKEKLKNRTSDDLIEYHERLLEKKRAGTEMLRSKDISISIKRLIKLVDIELNKRIRKRPGW